VRRVIALVAVTLAAGSPARAQEQPPAAADKAVERPAEVKPAAERDRARVEARLRELREQVAALEKQLADPDRLPERRAAERARTARAVEERTPAPAGPAVAGMAGGGAQLELVDLANSLVDASGALKQARMDAELHERMNKAGGVISQAELTESRIKLETAQKRVELLRGMAQVAMESARTKLEIVQKRYQQGMDGSDAVADAQGRVKMLELIVKGAD
jgi:FAD/FMN-containing dehydrogenase